MRHRLRFVLPFLAAFVHPVYAQSLPPAIRTLLLRDRVPLSGISIYAREIGQSKPVLSYQAHVARDPASVMKLVTSLVGLYTLGPAYAWSTGAYTNGVVKNGVLHGNLYLRGQGDPYLITKSFWNLLHGLRRRGIRRIDGDVVLDQRYITPPEAPRGAFDGDPNRTYNVRPQALLVNFQAVDFQFVPGPRAVRIIPDPDPTTLAVVNRVRETAGSCGAWQSRVRLRIDRGPTRNVALFTGTYPRACGLQHLYRVTDSDDRYVAGVFRALWRQQGGKFSGKVFLGGRPADTRLIYRVRSRPLADVLRSIDKYSNNVMGRLLVMTLGAVRYGPPGTNAKGLRVMRTWLDRHGLHLRQLVLRNGVGLSRVERITAAEVGRVLSYAYKGRYMPEYISALPIAGVDGTLRYRFVYSPVKGHLHAKTGTLDGVDTIAGYLQTHGHRYIVVVLENYPGADTERGFEAEDGVIKWLFVHE